MPSQLTHLHTEVLTPSHVTYGATALCHSLYRCQEHKNWDSGTVYHIPVTEAVADALVASHIPLMAS